MRYAINIKNYSECGDARVLADLAREAESAGWDGFFIWDHLALPEPAPVTDAWIALAAIAVQTEQIRIGALVTPLPRRRPWKFARETASLDRLAGGRLVVGVGIGGGAQEFDHLDEQADPKKRGAMLDEALEVVTGLWRGEPFSYKGEHYSVHEALFLPTPHQEPRIPIWVGGRWPNKPPFRRAARWDGVFPDVPGGDPNVVLTPDDIRAIVAYVREHRSNDAPFDVTMAGITPGDDLDKAAGIVAPYSEAGLTWWQESVHLTRPDLAERASSSSPLEAIRWRIRQGPPSLR